MAVRRERKREGERRFIRICWEKLFRGSIHKRRYFNNCPVW